MTTVGTLNRPWPGESAKIQQEYDYARTQIPKLEKDIQSRKEELIKLNSKKPKTDQDEGVIYSRKHVLGTIQTDLIKWKTVIESYKQKYEDALAKEKETYDKQMVNFIKKKEKKEERKRKREEEPTNNEQAGNQIKNYYLGDPEEVKKAMEAVANQGKAKK